MKRFFWTDSSLAYIRKANSSFAADITAEMYVLDAGAGTAPYRDLFMHSHYETADFQQVDKKYAKQTYVCDLSAIPVEDCRYDRIVFNQVLEHISDPERVLRELHRVLKPGGRVICTSPLFYHEHETPYDFYRFTQFGLRYLFEKAGFQVEKIDWLEGFLGTLAYQMRRIWKSLRVFDRQIISNPLGLVCVPFLVLLKGIAFVSAGILSALDLRIKITRHGYPLHYLTIARKP